MSDYHKKFSIAIVGATGLVGKTFIKILKEQNFPVSRLELYAKNNGVGKIVSFDKKEYIVKKLDESFSPNTDFVLFAASSDVSLKYAKVALKNGCTVIDNSSAFRMYNQVPLIIPDINFDCLLNKKLIANPNCSTIICAKPLSLLHDKLRLKRIRFSTYQAVSGAGNEAITALKNGNYSGVFPYDIRKTCLPKIGTQLSNGYTSEEIKMQDEMRKILNDKNLKISATCVRVPVENCHGISVFATFKENFTLNNVYEILKSQNDIIIADDLKNDVYPVATIANGNNKVYVGRIRKDTAENKSLAFYVLSDNLRTGAAYNAYEILRRISIK